MTFFEFLTVPPAAQPYSFRGFGLPLPLPPSTLVDLKTGAVICTGAQATTVQGRKSNRARRSSCRSTSLRYDTTTTTKNHNEGNGDGDRSRTIGTGQRGLRSQLGGEGGTPSEADTSVPEPQLVSDSFQARSGGCVGRRRAGTGKALLRIGGCGFGRGGLLVDCNFKESTWEVLHTFVSQGAGYAAPAFLKGTHTVSHRSFSVSAWLRGGRCPHNSNCNDHDKDGHIQVCSSALAEAFPSCPS